METKALMIRGAILLSIICLLLAVINVVSLKAYFEKRSYREGLFSNAIIAMELIRSKKDVDEVIGIKGESEGDLLRQKMSINLDADTFFIFSYTLFFILLTATLFHRQPLLGSLSILVSLIAASFDFLENSRIAAILKLAATDNFNTAIEAEYTASLIKWFSIFVVLGLIAILFLKHRNRLDLLLGIYLLCCSLLGIGGLFFYQKLLEIDMALMLIINLVLTVTLLVSPTKFQSMKMASH